MTKDGYTEPADLRIIKITDVKPDRFDLKDKLYAGKCDAISRYVVEKLITWMWTCSDSACWSKRGKSCFVFGSVKTGLLTWKQICCPGTEFCNLPQFWLLTELSNYNTLLIY
jgi:hypothetical protein